MADVDIAVADANQALEAALSESMPNGNDDQISLSPSTKVPVVPAEDTAAEIVKSILEVSDSSSIPEPQAAVPKATAAARAAATAAAPKPVMVAPATAVDASAQADETFIQAGKRRLGAMGQKVMAALQIRGGGLPQAFESLLGSLEGARKLDAQHVRLPWYLTPSVPTKKALEAQKAMEAQHEVPWLLKPPKPGWSPRGVYLFLGTLTLLILSWTCCGEASLQRLIRTGGRGQPKSSTPFSRKRNSSVDSPVRTWEQPGYAVWRPTAASTLPDLVPIQSAAPERTNAAY